MMVSDVLFLPKLLLFYRILDILGINLPRIGLQSFARIINDQGKGHSTPQIGIWVSASYNSKCSERIGSPSENGLSKVWKQK